MYPYNFGKNNVDKYMQGGEKNSESNIKKML